MGRRPDPSGCVWFARGDEPVPGNRVRRHSSAFLFRSAGLFRFQGRRCGFDPRPDRLAHDPVRELSDNRTQGRKSNQADHRRHERRFDSGTMTEAPDEHREKGQWAQDSGVRAAHVGLLGLGRQTWPNRHSLTAQSAPKGFPEYRPSGVCGLSCFFRFCGRCFSCRFLNWVQAAIDSVGSPAEITE